MAVAVGEVITAAQLNGLPVRLADSTLAADATTIDFTSIPSIYGHLLLECYARATGAVASAEIVIRFNNDSAANYDFQSVQGSAAVAAAAETFAATYAAMGVIPAATAGANLFGATVIEVPHYAQGSNNKAASGSYAHKAGTAGGNLNVGGRAGFWRASTAINRITFLTTSGNFLAGSRITLYGLP